MAGLLDFAIAFAVLLGMMLVYGVAPSASILALPLFVVLALAAALAVGIWLSALHVQYRDVRYTIIFLTQIWLYATPIAYPASLVRGPLHLALAINPMTGVVEGFRMALLGTGSLDPLSLAISGAVTVLALIGSLAYFRRMEQRFADII
jgi:lipopolysaccharide transport system permease protein